MSAFLKSRNSSRSHAFSAGIKVVAATAGILLLASCASTPADDGTTASPSAARAADGVLTVGTVLPQTGNLAFLGPPEFAGVDLAAAEIGESDFEFDIKVIHKDSGDLDTDVATQSAGELIDANADIVVGAASSGVSFTFIDQLIAAGVVQISPANTSPDFSKYADDGWYWRTAPSDVLQGRVLGNLMVGDGAEKIGIIYINDPYGTGLEENATIAIENAGGEVTASVPYNTGDTQFTSIVNEVLASGPDAIAVIAFSETASIIPELVNTQGFASDKVYFVDGNLSNSYEFPEGTLEGAKGTLPGNFAPEEFRKRLLEIDPALTDFSYSAEAYDAVIVSALAAAQGGSDDPTTIRDNLQAVSEGGTKCTVFADCLVLIANGEDIDYDGASGPITFDKNGDPTEAYIGIYQYEANNRYVPLNAEFGSLAE